uniref:Uncharacterized protein n=1 Tax=Lactuca sativa TaxID=4236 RepID=A0A9R1VMH0_LACSA|nr:hypothetical protein LSAT_V11C500295880 [Lactuca sativa]
MYALNLLRGTPEESFQRLPLYCYNLEKKNIRMVIHIKMSDDRKFEYFFMAIGCAIRFFYIPTSLYLMSIHVRAFQSCLRPIIIIDDTHLKGKYLGTMFLAVVNSSSSGGGGGGWGNSTSRIMLARRDLKTNSTSWIGFGKP